DPFRMFQRLLREFDNIFGALLTRPGAAIYVVLEPCLHYTRWLLFRRTWEPRVVRRFGEVGLDYRPSEPATTSRAVWWLRQAGWLAESVERPVTRARSRGAPARLAELDREPEDTLRARLGRLAAEAQEMRPHLPLLLLWALGQCLGFPAEQIHFEPGPGRLDL